MTELGQFICSFSGRIEGMKDNFGDFLTLTQYEKLPLQNSEKFKSALKNTLFEKPAILINCLHF